MNPNYLVEPSWTEHLSNGFDQLAGYAHTGVNELEELLSLPGDTAVSVIEAGTGGASAVIGSAGQASEAYLGGVGQASWGLAALAAAVIVGFVVLL